MAAQFYVRGAGLAFQKSLSEMGRRRGPEKGLYLVTDGGTELLLSLVSTRTSALPLRDEASRRRFAQVLEACAASPFVVRPLRVDFLPERELLAIVRPFVPLGSLRDVQYRTHPRVVYSHKYSASRVPHPEALQPARALRIAAHALHALLHLRQLGLAHLAHLALQPGNLLMLASDFAALSDVESLLLGLPMPAPRPRTEQESFARFLLELLTGRACPPPARPTIPPGLPAGMNDLLENLLAPQPSLSLENVAHHALFQPPPPELQQQPIRKLPQAAQTFFEQLRSALDRRYEDCLSPPMSPITSPRSSDSGTPAPTSATAAPPAQQQQQQQQKKKKKKKAVSPTPSSTSLATTQPSNSNSSTTPASAAPGAEKTLPSPLPKAPSPPPTGPKAPPPPSPLAGATAPPPVTSERRALLSSIEGFSIKNLKKVKTNDRSAPLLKK
jgi:hypothetical protein